MRTRSPTWLLTVVFVGGCAAWRPAPEEVADGYFLTPQAFLEPIERSVAPSRLPLPPVAIELAMTFEGYRARPYDDPAGYCTVGFGHLLKRARCDGTGPETPFVSGISKDAARQL